MFITFDVINERFLWLSVFLFYLWPSFVFLCTTFNCHALVLEHTIIYKYFFLYNFDYVLIPYSLTPTIPFYWCLPWFLIGYFREDTVLLRHSSVMPSMFLPVVVYRLIVFFCSSAFRQVCTNVWNSILRWWRSSTASFTSRNFLSSWSYPKFAF